MSTTILQNLNEKIIYNILVIISSSDSMRHFIVIVNIFSCLFYNIHKSDDKTRDQTGNKTLVCM